MSSDASSPIDCRAVAKQRRPQLEADATLGAVGSGTGPYLDGRGSSAGEDGIQASAPGTSCSTRAQDSASAAIDLLERELSSILRQVTAPPTDEGRPSLGSRAEERWPQAQELYRAHRQHLLEQRHQRQDEGKREHQHQKPQQLLQGRRRRQIQHQHQHQHQPPSTRIPQVVDASREQHVSMAKGLGRGGGGGGVGEGGEMEKRQAIFERYAGNRRQPQGGEEHLPRRTEPATAAAAVAAAAAQEPVAPASASSTSACHVPEHLRLEADAAAWRRKAEASWRSYRLMLSEAQTAQQARMKQAVDFASLRIERDSLAEANGSLGKELQETREALQETQAELATLKALTGKRRQPQRSSSAPRPQLEYPGTWAPYPLPNPPPPPLVVPSSSSDREARDAFAPNVSVTIGATPLPPTAPLTEVVDAEGMSHERARPPHERASYPRASGFARERPAAGKERGTSWRGGSVSSADFPVDEGFGRSATPAGAIEDALHTAPGGSSAWVKAWQERLRRRHGSSAMGGGFSRET